MAQGVRAALADTPVVLLVGARQTGKSTLAQSLIAGGYDADYVTLDDPAALAPVRADPDAFLSAGRRNLVLDEAQHAPADLFRAIKLAVDRDRRAGRFLVTGSVNILPRAARYLVGRMEPIVLWPLSQGEIEGRRERFVDAVFESDSLPVRETRDIRADVIARAVRGGFPEVVLRTEERRRRAWFGAYVANLLQRDVRDLTEVERFSQLPLLLRLLAARVTGLLNVSELSRSTGIPHTTLTRYLALLEVAFLLRRLPAWSGGIGKRLLKSPKVLLIDSALVAHLQDIDPERFRGDPTLLGPILENFVAMELIKQSAWSTHRPALYHYRSVTGDEVDFVLERRDGSLVGIEVKAAVALYGDEARGLRALASATGRKFRRGILFHLGREAVPFGPNIQAMPVTALWRA